MARLGYIVWWVGYLFFWPLRTFISAYDVRVMKAIRKRAAEFRRGEVKVEDTIEATIAGDRICFSVWVWGCIIALAVFR